MSTGSNILQGVVVELEKILRLLADKLVDNEVQKEIKTSLGLNDAGFIPSGIDNSNLDSIQQYTQKSNDDITLEAFASVVRDIFSVSIALDDFAHVVTSGDDPEAATEVADMIWQLCLMEYLRVRLTNPTTFYSILKLLDFYEELSTESGDICNFSKTIGGFLKRVGTSLNCETEDEAKLTSDTLFLLLAVTSYFLPGVRNSVKIIYGFDPSPDSTSINADELSERTITLSLTAKGTDLSDNEIEVIGYLSLIARPQSQNGGGIELLISGSGKVEGDIGNDWKLSCSFEEIPGADASVEIKIEKGGEPTRWIIGDTLGTRLEIGTASFSAKGSIADQDLDFNAAIEDCAFVLAKGRSDNFLAKLLPDEGINGNFAFGIGYSLKKGLYVDSGSGISVLIPLHVSIGPLTLNSFYTQAKGNDAKNGFSLETSIGFTTSFLGFTATIERIGLIHDFAFPDGKKNLGLADYSIGFKPPNGVGLSLDTGIIKGGGYLYLDFDKGEYMGALELDFIGIVSLKAIGIINTKMPDGSDGFSLLIIITAEFPPIQLGFGFTLNAVGGLLGLNRTTKIDVLREGVKTNAIKSILFPEDVVANISRIVSDIKQVFPPFQEHFVVGPMAELGWGTPSILTLEIGILLEIPVPRIAILGVIKAVLPDEDLAILRIQVNFLGVIDFQNQFISFDASLYDSRLLIYTLSGDMAFRLSWGDNPMFILSVGGFHPAFHDAPQDLQHMTRLTISLLSGDNPRISVQSYFAVTSNTVQFGARAELYAEACGFNVYGFIGYDVLFQFDPFKFVADFYAGLALRSGDSVIMGISVAGELSGPTPWNAQGSASIDFFFFSISVGFNETWGDSGDNAEPERIDLTTLLNAEINDDRNWKAVIPDNNNLHVSIKTINLPDAVVIHPFGTLTFSERLLPLDISITKFGNKVPQDANRFEIRASDPGVTSDNVKEQFAPANFFDKSDNEKLSSPSFELMNSGFKITGTSDLKMPIGISKNVDYELTYLHKKQSLLKRAGLYKFGKKMFKSNLKASAVSQSKLSYTKNKISSNAPDSVTVPKDQFAIANVSDMKLYNADLIAGSYTEAKQQYEELISKNPALKDQVQILSNFELNMN
jgi:hypothetical protein